MYRIDGPDELPFTWQLFHIGGSLLSNGKAKTTAIVDATKYNRGMYVIKVNGPYSSQSEMIMRQ